MWCLRPLCYSFPSLKPKLLISYKGSVFHPLCRKGSKGRRSTHVNHDPNLQRSCVYEILEEKFCASSSSGSGTGSVSVSGSGSGSGFRIPAFPYACSNTPIYLLQATWSSKMNLRSHTLLVLNNQFGRTFGLGAFHFPLINLCGLWPVGPV